MTRTTKLSLVPAAAILVSMAGCGRASQHDVNEKFYLIASNIKVPYWQHAFAGLSKAAGALQVQAEMAGPDKYDPKGQHEAFQRVLAKKPAGILLSAADPELVKPDIQAAIAQGVPVITIDSDAPGSRRLFFIGTDNYKAGMMGGQLAAKRLNGKGSVIVFSMPEQVNLKERLHGYQDAFTAYPQIKIVEVVDIHGNPTVAFDKTMELIEKSKSIPDGFICLEAIACPEVADVLDRKNVKGKIVVAMDTDERTLQGIKKGTISATIAQKPFTMAYFGLRVLDGLVHHKLTPLDANFAEDSRSPVPMFVDTGATLIDPGNVESFLKETTTAELH
ncbi:MAG: substrate-binding domain-containing protein [Bryobacteraceae bacterium]